jgi:hypothetical protein
MFHHKHSPKQSHWYKIPKLVIDLLGSDYWLSKIIDQAFMISMQDAIVCLAPESKILTEQSSKNKGHKNDP